MKKIYSLLIICFSVISFNISAQDDAVDVETSIKKISDTEYDLIFDFYIDDDWHLYSQYNPEDASAPMKILPAEGETGFTLEGKAKESETHTEYSETWEMDEIFFKEEAQLVQRVIIEDEDLETIVISIKAQVCKEFCLPFEGEYEFELDGASDSAEGSTAKENEEKKEGKEKKTTPGAKSGSDFKIPNPFKNLDLGNISLDLFSKNPILVIVNVGIALLSLLLGIFIGKRRRK